MIYRRIHGQNGIILGKEHVFGIIVVQKEQTCYTGDTDIVLETGLEGGRTE